MKTIYLMRHAKSSWKKPLADHERPLKKRGRKAAKKIGEYLAKRDIHFDLLISSDARRAVETTRIVSKALGEKVSSVVIINTLYGASPNDILSVIADIDDSIESVLLVGHNPDISRAAVILSGENDLDWMPTAAIAGIVSNYTHWKDFARNGGELVCYATPRTLDGES